MRVIKFRGKKISDNSWVFGHYSAFDGEGDDYHYIGNTKGMIVRVTPETVGQFTGLHDKNGKEIFEGDIMETELFTKYFQITFGNSEKWGSSFCHQSHNSIYVLNKNFADTSEVIGNIYENKELLNQ